MVREADAGQVRTTAAEHTRPPDAPKHWPSLVRTASSHRWMAHTGQSADRRYGSGTVTPFPARSPLERGRVSRRPRGRLEVLDANGGGSEQRDPPAKPTSSKAPSRKPGGSSQIGDRLWASRSAVAASFFSAAGRPRRPGGGCQSSRPGPDLGLGGRDRAAGNAMDIADRGAPDLDRRDREAAAAFGGEESDDVGRAGREGSEAMPVTPGGTVSGYVGYAADKPDRGKSGRPSMPPANEPTWVAPEPTTAAGRRRTGNQPCLPLKTPSVMLLRQRSPCSM